jgi:hypothetical protein
MTSDDSLMTLSLMTSEDPMMTSLIRYEDTSMALAPVAAAGAAQFAVFFRFSLIEIIRFSTQHAAGKKPRIHTR